MQAPQREPEVKECSLSGDIIAETRVNEPIRHIRVEAAHALRSVQCPANPEENQTENNNDECHLARISGRFRRLY
jgi:hypothetical protein